MTQYPAVVHVDIDFAFLQPMDELFDAIVYPKDSVLGQAARKQIARERPTDAWPDQIDAFLTRDWPQVVPGRIAGYQAGFIVRFDPMKPSFRNLQILSKRVTTFLDLRTPMAGVDWDMVVS
jgi:hypothetical protein